MEDCQRFVTMPPRSKNKYEMAQTIQSTWDKISLEQLQTLVRTMPDKMQVVL